MTATQEYSKLDQVSGLRRELVELIDQLATVAAGVELSTQGKILQDLRERVANDTFSVLVMGEFNAGKSTTINAMLGRKILPASANPTTAVLSVVRFGEQPGAVLFAADPNSRDGLDATPVPIDIADLTKYVTVDDRPGQINRWGKAEITWPIELCRRGVQIVDSPGLNEQEDRARITMEFVGRADAIVFVFSAIQPMKSSERAVVSQYLTLFRDDNIFLLVNRINQVDEEEVDLVKSKMISDAKKVWDIGAERIFFVNAKGALTGREKGNPAAAGPAGLVAFEQQLEHFLSTQRARLKIVPPARALQVIVDETRDSIDQVLTMLDHDVEEINTRYERTREPLDRLQRDRHIIGVAITNHLAMTRGDVEASAARCLTEAANSCVEWSQQIERTAKVNLNFLKAKQNAQAVAEEIANGLGERIEQHVIAWQDNELRQLLEARSTDLQRQIGESLDAFTEQVRQIRLSFADVRGTHEVNAPSNAERAAAGIVGMVLDPGSALFGVQFGFKKMLKNILPQLAVAIGVALLGFGPGVIWAMLLGSGVIRSLWKLDKLNKEIVSTVANTVAEKLRAEVPERARSFADTVHASLDEMRQEIDGRLAAQIERVHEEVRFVLKSRDDAKQNADEVRQRLTGYKATLSGITQRAGVIIEQSVLSA